ncbi:MAG: Xylose isomerase-like barrel [Armatimonadetes bacterium]|jgi:sugar phosphate isomerase/epimerase|nr:Xylose isomerase-like barrel [Armatimonadota bacterium]
MKTANTTRRGLLAGMGAALVTGAVDLTTPAEAQGKKGDPPFGLGTVTYNVPKDWDLPTLLKILPAAGVPSIEFRTTHAHGVELTLNASQRAEVKQRCADAGIKQISLGTTCEFQSPDPSVVKKFIDETREWAKLAKDLGALGVKVRPNGLPKDVPVEKTLEQIGKALRECGAAAQDNGVEIWVEVHGAGTQEPANMRKIMDYCGHKSVGVNWNSNPTDVRNGSVKEAFDLLKPFLMSVHINSLWSDYPYRELFSLLRQANYTRYTNCEVGNAVKAEDGLVFFQCYRGLWRELARG